MFEAVEYRGAVACSALGLVVASRHGHCVDACSQTTSDCVVTVAVGVL
jgi:hypothetical protein